MTNRSLFKILLRGEFLFPFLLFVCLWLYIFLSTKIFEVGFNYFLDDHQIFINNSEKFDLYKIFIDPFASLFSSNEPKTRFRPLYDVWVRLFSHVYGLNPFFWYLSSFIAALATTTNFYIFARLQSFPVLESICFSLLVVFGDQAWTYVRFGTPETTATFFASLAFIFASLSSNKNSIILDSLFCIFAILTALNKEACLLMLPAFAFLKVWSFSRKYKISLAQSLSINRYIVSLILTICLLTLIYIKLAGFVGIGYAGIDENTFAVSNISRLLKTLFDKSSIGLAIILNVIYFILCFFRFKTINFGFLILSSLIIIPQLILYCKSDIGNYYLLPCVIGVSFLTIYPLVELKKKISKNFAILSLFVILIIYNNLVSTQNIFRKTSINLKTMNEMVQDISSCLKPNSQLIIFGNPYAHYEPLYGFKTAIIDKILQLKEEDVVLATYGYSNSNLKSDAYKEFEKAWSFLKPSNLEISYNHRTIKTLDRSQLKNTQVLVILGFHEFEKDFRKLTSDWFDVNQFNYKSYPDLDIGDISIYCKK